MTRPQEQPLGSWRSRNVIALGVISLLTDVASDAAIPLLPAFILTLGGGAMVIGWIEGVAEAVSSVLKLLFGRWSDRIGKSRPFVISGYALSSVAKPLLALALAPWHVLAVRITDRVGKGLRTSPRDALIAASVRPEERGAAFGLHKSMDHAGAVIGPLCAAALLLWVTDDLRIVFWLTAIPGLLVIVAALVGVREVPRPAVQDKASGPADHGLARFLVPLGLFTLAKASEVFLILKLMGESVGESLQLAAFPLVWVGLHVVKMACSVPGGKIADRWGKRRVIAFGWLLFACTFACLAFAQERWVIAVLLGLYAVYGGLTEAAEKALVADIVPRNKQGAAFGWYHLTLGLLALAASALFGTLWQLVSAQVAFLTSAGFAVAALAMLFILGMPQKPGEVMKTQEGGLL